MKLEIAAAFILGMFFGYTLYRQTHPRDEMLTLYPRRRAS